MSALVEGPHTTSVADATLDAAGGPVEAIVARPTDEAPRAAVVLIPDIMGLRPLFRDMGRRLATHGLAVVAIEPFADMPPATRATLDVAARMDRVKDLRDDRMTAALAAAADRAESLAGGRARVLGFCMGAYFTLKAAASGRFAAAVPIYGMIRTPERWRGPGLADPIDRAGATCRTLAIFGGRDSYSPPAEIAELRAAWQSLPQMEIVIYPEAEHGFIHDPDRPAHRAEDAADAWRRALAVLGA
jgi:carboxymethylenebutenolidase